MLTLVEGHLRKGKLFKEIDFNDMNQTTISSTTGK